MLLNRCVSTSLDVAPHSSLQLRVLKLPEIAPRHIVLKVLLSQGHSTITEETIREAFLHWIQSLNDGLVVYSGSIIRFDMRGENSVSASIEVEYDAEENISEKQLEGK